MWKTIDSLKKIHAETIGAENTALSKYTDFLNTKRCLNKNILKKRWKRHKGKISQQLGRKLFQNICRRATGADPLYLWGIKILL